MIRPIVIASTIVAVLASCGPPPGLNTPHAGLTRYSLALRNPDPRPAYQMLSRDEKKRTPYLLWAKQWQLLHQERRAQSRALESSLTTHKIIRPTATVQFQDGRDITLRREADGWRLNHALVGRVIAPTPGDALAMFSVAVSERKLDAILQTLSKRHRDGIQKKLHQFHESLQQKMAEGDREIFEVHPERAEIAWNRGELRYRLVLVKEEGNWRIDDIQLGPDSAYDAKTESDAEEKGSK